ncbi:MAG: hypothetical protein EHM59_11595 [Betaproteobacteria bacterium]|nr:MAG: hypothetical protein EHM59_11595 [Betaproteobacteria bacterium]
MTRLLSTILVCLAATAAHSQDSPIGNETPAAEQAPEKAVSETTAAAEDADKPFTPPPGFQTKKRGEMVLYCKRDRETGTRFTTEKCYDEDQVREYLLALEIQKRDIDRIRSTCATASVCSPQ